MKFSYNWLKELSTFKESPEELAEFLTLRAFEVKSTERKDDDWIIDIETKTLASRMADAGGHWGLAREVAFLKKMTMEGGGWRVEEDKKKKISDYLKIKIENPDDCPRYTARVIADITVKESPEWMKKRLETCGIQSINNIVDAANYVMLELGQPLHIFDFEKLRTQNSELRTILVRRAKNGEKITTLDNKTHALSPEIFVIADEKDPIAIAGVKGGKDSGVSENTKTIIIESANFSPARIRIGSQKLKLKTDASIRFEHGLSPAGTEQAADRLAHMIQEVAGGTIFKGRADAYLKKYMPPRILFRKEYADRIIGKELPLSFYKNTFQGLGAAASPKGKNQMMVQPPTLRLDLLREEDLIEEIVRLLGYDAIPAKPPETASFPSHVNDELFWMERVQDFLSGAGFFETLLSSFTGDRELDQFFLDRKNIISIENPTRPETAYLVSRAVIQYALSAAENLRRADSIKLFGVAKDFSFVDEKPCEQKKLILTLAQKGTKREEGFYELKGVLDQLFESLGMADHWYDAAASRQIYHPYRVAEIKIGDILLGMMGEIHPAVRENIKAKTPITVAEIDFEMFWKAARSEAEYKPIGKYPSVVRDIAVIVPEEIKTQEVMDTINNAASEILSDIDLFDYFRDEELQRENQKSLAFHLIFQSPNKTLKDEEVNTQIKNLIAALEKSGWTVKK